MNKLNISKIAIITIYSVCLLGIIVSCQRSTPLSSNPNTKINSDTNFDTLNAEEDKPWLVAILSEYLDSSEYTAPVTPTCPQNSTSQITGHQIVNSQETVDALANIQLIDGDLRISSSNNLDFSPLNSLKEVTGNIVIQLNQVQENIASFNCLTTIEGGLFISNNPNLKNISGFNKLESIGEGFSIFRNSALEVMSDFEALITLGGDFRISINQSLLNIPDFPSLETIGNFDSVSGSSFYITGNHAITNISSFPILTEIQTSYFSNFSITSNNKLVSINGLNQLTLNTFAFTVSISANPLLDCTMPTPNFVPVSSSTGNLVNCLISP